MEFIGALVQKDFGSRDLHLQEMYRQYMPIPIGENSFLSIQASYGHYCTPRKTLEDLKAYSHWEIALFNEEDFLRVGDLLPNFKSLYEIELYHDGSVYPYVPADLIEELYLALKED